MHPSSQLTARFVLALIAAVSTLGLFTAEAASANPGHALKNWKLANGEHLQASIVGYSRHNRVITLELPSGKRVHLAPRDLAGAGKFNWLTSDAFLISLSGYQVPDKAALPLVQTILGVSIAGLLGLFLAFWAAVAILTGQRSPRRAATVFGKFILTSTVIGLIGIVAAWVLGKSLDHTTLVAIAISTVYLITIALTLAKTCRIIGNHYGTSEWTGIQALFFALILFAAGSVVVVIGLPRAMNQPGIDDWLTEQVLTPMELAADSAGKSATALGSPQTARA